MIILSSKMEVQEMLKSPEFWLWLYLVIGAGYGVKVTSRKGYEEKVAKALYESDMAPMIKDMCAPVLYNKFAIFCIVTVMGGPLVLRDLIGWIVKPFRAR